MANKRVMKFSQETKDKLDEIKIHKRETYDDVVQRLLEERKK